MSTTTATTATISLDSFRRRPRTDNNAARTSALDVHPLVGTALGVIARRYGLMSTDEPVVVCEVVATSGDLGVADRLAYIAAIECHEPVVVIEVEGWYLACRTERTLDASQLDSLLPGDGAPRIMSIANERGITPALGPLVA